MKLVSDEHRSPFAVKETYENLEEEWEETAEVLNSKEAMGLFLAGW